MAGLGPRVPALVRLGRLVRRPDGAADPGPRDRPVASAPEKHSTASDASTGWCVSDPFSGQPVYSDLDAHACAWLRRLINAGHLTRGRVVEQDIREIAADNAGGGKRFHAFAGSGLWEYAIQLAGWPDELPVWTGSCPCQPFSVAGRGLGTNDDRHLWPAWFRLIRKCRPPVVFGEQVVGPAGRAWFDLVSSDLEEVGYAVGAADLCAAGVGAPHLRQRLYFVAHLPVAGWSRRWRASLKALPAGVAAQPRRHGDAHELGEPNVQRCEGIGVRLRPRVTRSAGAQVTRAGAAGIVGNSDGERGRRHDRAVRGAQAQGRPARCADGSLSHETKLAGYTCGFWADAEWILCRDGKARATEPGTFPLAHGRAGRVAVVRPGEQAGSEAQETHWYNRNGALKCIGNAIVPQAAAVFIGAALRSIYDSASSNKEAST